MADDRSAAPRIPGYAPETYSDPETDPTGEAQKYTWVTGRDPETGESVTYRQRTTFSDKERKARRQQRRDNRRIALQQLQQRENYYGGLFNEQLGGIGGAFAGLEGEIPSELDLLGGQEWAESALAGAQADEGAIAAQRAALAQLGEISRGGYTAEEAAAMQRMRAETAQQEQAQRQAVMQQMAMRGMSGSGAELAQQLAAQQGGANRMNASQLETQAQAQRRALQALGMQSDAAGQMRGQSFGEESTRRGATDDFTRWNLDRRGGAAQQRYANRFGLAQAQSGAASDTAQLAGQRRQQVQEEKQGKKDKALTATTQLIDAAL